MSDLKQKISSLKQNRDSIDKELNELRSQYRYSQKKDKVKGLFMELYNEKKKTIKEEEDFDYNSIGDPDVVNFIKKRIGDFSSIQNKLNVLIPLLRDAKRKTIQKYRMNPSKEILYGTDIAISYLDDLITLFSKPDE